MKIRITVGPGTGQIVHVDCNEHVKLLLNLGFVEKVQDEQKKVIQVSWVVGRDPNGNGPVRINASCNVCRGAQTITQLDRGFIHCRMDKVPEQVLKDFQAASGS